MRESLNHSNEVYNVSCNESMPASKRRKLPLDDLESSHLLFNWTSNDDFVDNLDVDILNLDILNVDNLYNG